MIKGMVTKNTYYGSLLILSFIWGAVFYLFAKMAIEEKLAYEHILSEINTNNYSLQIDNANEKVLSNKIAQLSVMKSCAIAGFHIMEDHAGGGWIMECEGANVKRLSADDMQKIKAKIQERRSFSHKTQTEKKTKI